MECIGAAIINEYIMSDICLMGRWSKPLQWCVYLLNATEVPSRHLFKRLNRARNGPYFLKHIKKFRIWQKDAH